MSNEKNNGTKAPSKAKIKKATEEAKAHLAAEATPADVRRWIETDCQSAIYFLSMVMKTPNLLDKMAAEMHAHAHAKQQFPEDHLEKTI